MRTYVPRLCVQCVRVVLPTSVAAAAIVFFQNHLNFLILTSTPPTLCNVLSNDVRCMQWRRLCSKEEFAEISNAAIFPNDTEVRVPKHVLKAWKDNYLVRVMLNMMTPLTKLQEDNMRKYGIGATHFQQQVWKYGGDPEVAEVKHQLEYMMTQIHPTASDTETSNSGSGSSSGGEDSLY